MKLKYLPLILITIFVSFLISCNSESGKSKGDYKKSVSISDSIEYLTYQITQDSLDGELWKKRASLFIKKGNIDAAFRDINKGLELNPKDPELYMLLADVYFAIGQNDNSISAIRKAIELDPDNPDYYLKMAKFKLILEKYKTAKAFADKVLRLDPDNEQAYYIKSIAFLEEKDTVDALKYMKIAASVDTSFFAANLNVAVLLDAKKDSSAEEYYKRALKIKPENMIAEYSLAMLYQKEGKFEKALETYKSLVSKHPDNAQAYFNMGYIYLTENLDFENAEKMFEKAIEIKPDYTEAVYNLGRVYEAESDTVRAIEKYRQALKLTTNYPLAIDGINRLEK